MSHERNQRREKRLRAFRVLVQERVVQLNVAWVQLEQGVTDREVGENLMRELHTLKGEAGLLGFLAVAEVAHVLEDSIGQVIDTAVLPTPEVGDQILEAFDMLSALSEREPDAPAPEAAELVTRLKALSNVPINGEQQGSVPPARKAATSDIGAAKRPDKPLQSIAPIESELLQPRTYEESSVAIPIPIPSDSPRKAASYSVRVNPEQLDQIRDIIGELLLTRTRLANSAAALHKQRHEQHIAAGRALDGSSELAGNELLRSIENQLRDDVLRMSTLVSALDGVTRDLRMVPISMIFDQYPLAVRSLSRSLGREVQLVCQGEGVEADRDVLEALNDSLIHLVRNAVDHAIEPPDVRESLGKSRFGTIILTASVTGDILHLEVRDDGAGIDVERVRAKAIEKGIIDPGTARTMEPRQVLRCLFEPGMSTSTKISQTSGRGVGLDVVLKTARNLGGTVDVSSMLAAGTTFRISVPIRASITSVMLFHVGQGRYAVPTNTLAAIIDFDDYHQVQSIDGPALQYDEGLLPIVDLEQLLNEEPHELEEDEQQRVLVTRHGTMLIGLKGSYNHLQREAVLKPVGSMLREDKLISAGVALEDGSVALVLNSGEVYRASRGQSAAPSERAWPTRLAARVAMAQKTVLVAEDSPIVRDLVVEALRVHGLEVIEAVDGRDALQKLEMYPEIQLLVTDVEMPHLDGLALIKEMRARTPKHIPAVVVSTRGSEADKEAAQVVGADAYLVKSDFSKEGLWSLVSRFLG